MKLVSCFMTLRFYWARRKERIVSQRYLNSRVERLRHPVNKIKYFFKSPCITFALFFHLLSGIFRQILGKREKGGEEFKGEKSKRIGNNAGGTHRRDETQRRCLLHLFFKLKNCSFLGLLGNCSLKSTVGYLGQRKSNFGVKRRSRMTGLDHHRDSSRSGQQPLAENAAHTREFSV